MIKPETIAAIISLLAEDMKNSPQIKAPDDWPPVLDIAAIVNYTGLPETKARDLFHRVDFPVLWADRQIVGRDALYLYLNGLYPTQKNKPN